MELRKSGKVAVGIIAALGTIGALHIFIFKNRAASYQQAKIDYEAANAEYQAQGSALAINDIQKFRYLTMREKLRYWETLKGLNVVLPAAYSAPPGSIDLGKYHRQEIWDFLRDIENRKAEGDAGAGPKLSFLMNPRGWALTNSLPKGLIDRNIAVEDELTTLTNEDSLLQSLGRDTTTYMDRERKYNILLARLGLDVTQRTTIRDNMGELPATLYTLNRIDQVLKKLPADYFHGMDEEAKMKRMYSLFRIEWPKDPSGNESVMIAAQQATGVRQILDAAKAEKVEEISYLKMHPQRQLSWEDPAIALAAAAATPAAVVAGGDMWGITGDEAIMAAESGGMYGNPAAAAPTPNANAVGYGAPVEIMAMGSNATVSAFLYRLAHSPNPLELDQLRIAAVQGQQGGGEGRVQALAFFNIVAMANYTLNPPVTTQDIERKIVETQIIMADLAIKPGAREYAQQDGLVVQQGNNWVLAKPSPTPYPTPIPTPAPTPDPNAPPPAPQ